MAYNIIAKNSIHKLGSDIFGKRRCASYLCIFSGKTQELINWWVLAEKMCGTSYVFSGPSCCLHPKTDLELIIRQLAFAPFYQRRCVSFSDFMNMKFTFTFYSTRQNKWGSSWTYI